MIGLYIIIVLFRYSTQRDEEDEKGGMGVSVRTYVLLSKLTGVCP